MKVEDEIGEGGGVGGGVVLLVEEGDGEHRREAGQGGVLAGGGEGFGQGLGAVDRQDVDGRWPQTLGLGQPTEADAAVRPADVRAWVQAWQAWPGPGSVRWPAKDMGADNDYVWRGLAGLSEAELTALTAKGVV